VIAVCEGDSPQRLGHRHSRHAGHRTNAVDQPAVEGLGLFGRVVQHGGCGIQADQMVRAKFGRHHQYVSEAGEKHAGGDQHHHGERDLAGHQNVAAEGVPLPGRAIPARLQRLHEVRARCLPGRRQAEEDTTHQRREQAELHDTPIQLYAQHIRWIAGHAERFEQPDTSVGDEQPCGAARHRHDETLGHQLAYHAAPPRSDREPYGDLAAAGAAPGKQQVRHVRACNDQDERHQPYQHLGQRQQLWTLLDAPLQFRADCHASVAIRLYILALQGGPDNGKFSLRRFP